MVLTRSQRNELSSQRQRSSDSVTSVKSKGNSPMSVPSEPPQQYGRGCRERKPVHFFEEEMAEAEAIRTATRASRRKANGDSSSDDDSEKNSIHYNRRFPERDAARRAMEKMNTLIDEESADERVPARKSDQGPSSEHSRSHPRHKRHHRDSDNDSSVSSSAIATPSSSSSDERSYKSDSSTGIVDEADAKRAVRAAQGKLPLSKVVDNIVQGAKSTPNRRTPSQTSRTHHKRPRDGDDDDVGATRSKATEEGGEGGTSAEALGDITPLPVDPSVTFATVGGMPQHIIALREMVMVPLLYPDLLTKLGVRPPRGVLFVGPPGTGKTLMARAVANESQIASQKKVSFFMRKGADILSKWVGESEKQLRLLFDEARKRQPSIIFFDEIDGLAPVRHSKQEQSHAALVSTLLALMDGLDDRGQVIVIGATNRPDTVDPALRRPGRFDRELRFPVPDEPARRHIIDIHTAKLQVGDEERRQKICTALLEVSEGWTGADIHACLTEATLHALRSRLPQIFVANQRLRIPADKMQELTLTEQDVRAAVLRLAPSMRRGAAAHGIEGSGCIPPIVEHIELLLGTPIHTAAGNISNHWQPACQAVRQAAATKCEDMRAAVKSINMLPLPHVPRGCLAFVTANGQHEFSAVETAKGLVKRYSSFPVAYAALPRLLRGNGGSVQLHAPSRGSSAYDESEMHPSVPPTALDSNICSLFATLRNLSPSILCLHDVDEWFGDAMLLNTQDITTAARGKKTAIEVEEDTEEDEEEDHTVQQNLNTFRYELISALQSNDVLVVIPMTQVHVASFEERILGTAVVQRIHKMQLQCMKTLIEDKPTQMDCAKWVQYLWKCAETVFMHAAEATSREGQWETFPVDDRPPPPPSPRTRRAAHERDVALWQRVEYKRRQLRHLLAQWLSQFIAGRKFQVLLSADLDLTEDNPLWKDWQKHTRGRRIGLQDIMEKLENEEYTCLSQYVVDVEQLCSNVRTFFTTRSLNDQKYRHRAMHLKEMTVLNMYKIHKRVTQFCEEHKDLTEPISSSSSDEGTGEDEESTAGDGEVSDGEQNNNQSVRATTKKKSSSAWRGGRRRRRQTSRKTSPPSNTQADAAEGEHANVRQPSVMIVDDSPDAKQILVGSAPPATLLATEPIVSSTPNSSGRASSSSFTSTSQTSTSSSSTSSSRSRSRSSATDRSEQQKAKEPATETQLFPAISLPSMPHNRNASSQDCERWCVLAASSLCTEECHMVTIRILAALETWRWSQMSSNDATTAKDKDMTWELRFTKMWHTELTHILASRQ